MLDEILLVNFATTWGMIGLIWMVQLVHYPLMSYVPNEKFTTFEDEHKRRITYIVAPLMLLESVTAAMLVFLPSPEPIRSALILGFALVLGNWISTILVQIPCHGRLSKQFDPIVHRLLVRSNWLRTFFWSVRGIVMLFVVWHRLIDMPAAS